MASMLRNLILAMAMGLSTAAVVVAASLALSTPNVWPGAVLAFIVTTCTQFVIWNAVRERFKNQ